jgi:Na+-transporting NADH:ubiquinone oxidoreductase subunit C
MLKTMNTNTNGYTMIYATIMVVIVALMLAVVSSALKSTQTANIELDKKKQILNSLKVDLENKDIAKVYDEIITKAILINSKAEVISEDKKETFDTDFNKEMGKKPEERKLPVYIAKYNGKTLYILTLKGAGLWGPIWGYVALNEDKNSIFGTYFSHASETPGLGSDIATTGFQNKFIGKHILNDQKEFVSIGIMKKGQTDTKREQIDALSGGTITSKGVEKMLYDCMSLYEEFFVLNNGGNVQ